MNKQSVRDYLFFERFYYYYYLFILILLKLCRTWRNFGK